MRLIVFAALCAAGINVALSDSAPDVPAWAVDWGPRISRPLGEIEQAPVEPAHDEFTITQFVLSLCLAAYTAE